MLLELLGNASSRRPSRLSAGRGRAIPLTDIPSPFTCVYPACTTYRWVCGTPHRVKKGPRFNKQFKGRKDETTLIILAAGACLFAGLLTSAKAAPDVSLARLGIDSPSKDSDPLMPSGHSGRPQAIPIEVLQLASICRLRNFRRTVTASNAVTASSMATMINTDIQLPVVCLRNAAAGPPKIEPTPCAI